MNKGRRRLLIATGVGVTGVLVARPSVKGGGHDAYYQGLEAAMQKANLYKPTLVIDKERLLHNIARLRHHLPSNKAYRVVAKSLPSIPLLKLVMAEAKTQRLMLFHQPFINKVAQEIPDAHVLLGKPLPVGAAQRFYEVYANEAKASGTGFKAAEQLEWLVDTLERAKEYANLAKTVGPMKINFEIDVGLHRGGFTDQANLKEAVALVDADPNLSVSGLMGYEPHIPKVPGVFGGPEGAMEKAVEMYTASKATLKVVLGDRYDEATLTLNTGGSQTYQLYDENAPANEIAMGSGLVMPTDFDLPTLADHQAATFISTPVLKAMDKTELPGAESLRGVFSWWDRNSARTYYIYGGHFLANLESPSGLQKNGLWGHSTNQEMINGSDKVKLKVGDMVVLRPHQSEAVFLRYGDIAVYDASKGEISEFWPVLTEG